MLCDKCYRVSVTKKPKKNNKPESVAKLALIVQQSDIRFVLVSALNILSMKRQEQTYQGIRSEISKIIGGRVSSRIVLRSTIRHG